MQYIPRNSGTQVKEMVLSRVVSHRCLVVLFLNGRHTQLLCSSRKQSQVRVFGRASKGSESMYMTVCMGAGESIGFAVRPVVMSLNSCRGEVDAQLRQAAGNSSQLAADEGTDGTNVHPTYASRNALPTASVWADFVDSDEDAAARAQAPATASASAASAAHASGAHDDEQYVTEMPAPLPRRHERSEKRGSKRNRRGASHASGASQPDSAGRKAARGGAHEMHSSAETKIAPSTGSDAAPPMPTAKQVNMPPATHTSQAAGASSGNDGHEAQEPPPKSTTSPTTRSHAIPLWAPAAPDSEWGEFL